VRARLHPWSVFSRLTVFLLMNRGPGWLACRKGLSRYYEGKSQSFACMSEVRCLEDLRKKGSPYKHRTNKSYGALGLGLGGMMWPRSPPPAPAPTSASPPPTGSGRPTAPIQNGYHQ
jgi:hypothetical protein